MTHEGAPVAAIVDYEAFLVLRPALDALQAQRNAGRADTPAGWSLMCCQMLTDGYAREACEVAA
jgi:hypothetical protein